MALIKMKNLLLLMLFACSCMVWQTFSWKIGSPTLPVNFGFSRRLQGSLFGDKSATGQSQAYLTLDKGSQKPHVKQRTIRDLMNRFMANNRRIPMASAPSYNRPGVQNGPVNPSVPQNFRGPSSQTRYRQALPLPSSPVSHSMDNPRPQSMIRQGPSLRKPNVPSSLRPESMLHNPPRRPPTPRNISPLRKEVKASLPSRNQPPRQHNTAPLGSAMSDILSSSSTSQIRNQNAPKRVVEVVHHLPLSRLNTHSPAVVYISKPKANIPSPQSMYMRDIPETQMLPPSQGKLPQNSPFIMNGQDSIIPKRNNLNQDAIPLKNNFQNTGISAPKSKPIHHQMQTSYLVPPTGLQGKYLKDNTEDHRNLHMASVLNKSPPAQVLGGMRPSAHMKQESSPSFVRPISTQNNTPRLNRLRQELNAEIQELLKLVSPDPASGTKRPRIVPQRQIPPHPYLVPSSQYEDTLGTNNPENINVQHKRKIPVQKSNHLIRQRPPLPQFSRPENIKEQALKIQTANRVPFPPSSDGLALNQRRPVVSESSVDSEELSQILKSVGYEDDSKFIRNAAGVRPVKLIIPGEDGKGESHTSSSSETVFNSPSYNSKDLASQNFNSFSSQNENLKLSQDENSSSHLAEALPISQNENIMPPHNQYPPSSNNKDLPPAENTYVSISDDEDVSSYQEEFSPPVDSTTSPPLDAKHQNLSNIKDSLYLENEEDSESSEDEFFLSHQNEDDSALPHNPESLSSQNKENSQPSDKKEVQHLPSNESLPSEAENSTYSKTVEHSLHTDNLSSDSNIEPSNEASIKLNGRHLANESLSSNKSSVVKTYWDFRKLNGHLQAETSSPKIVKIEKQPPFSHSVNNYQGEESIASVSVKDDLSDEDLKEKNNNKGNKDKPNSGTLYDIYNKKILDEKKQDVPASHSVRYLPQHYVPEEPEIESVPNFEKNNKSPELIHPVDSLNTNPGDTKIIYKAASNFLKPKEKIRNEFPALNIRERPVIIRTTTMIPKYLTTNRNFNVNLFQRTTPKYFVTKAPPRQHFGLRNRPLNANNLNQRYFIPGRQQFNNNAFLQNLNPPVDHRVPEMHVQHYTDPRVTNYWLKPSTTESTIQSPSVLHSSELKKYNLGIRAQNQFNVYGMSKSTTETPSEVIHDPEVTPSESQIRNTQEAENKEFSQTSETIRSTNKQFFRGPQHSITFEYSTTESYQKPTVNLVPSSNSFETTTSSVMSEITEDPELKESIPYNETGGVPQYSVHTQTKVINALHLANKVFGRRNHTSHKQWLTTTKIPRHKFSYSPVTKPTMQLSLNQSESNENSKKVVFNFRTGTTQSLPLSPSSAAPKIINNSENSDKLLYKVGNDSLEFVPSLKEKDKIVISPKNSSKASLFHHIVFSQPNISSKPTINESTVTETNKDLYGILKPITKPYNSSTTSDEEKEVRKLTTKVFRIRINSTTIKTTTPLSTTEFITTQQVTHSPSTSVPVVSDVSVHIKKQRVLPTTTESVTKTTKESMTEETTAPYTSTTVIQTVAPTKDNLVANITVSPTEVATEPIDQEQLIVDSLKSMKLKMQEMASKGLRHIMPLVMELSSDVSISSDCTFSLLRWLRAVRTMEQWAVRMMDASSKIPEGILYGTFSTFGSYDECIGIKTPKANLQMPYSGQYCSINIQPILPPKSRHFTTQNAFKRYPKLKQVFQEMNIDEDTMAYYYILKHRIGLCMPSTCSIEDLGNVTEKMADQLNMKISVERCETSEKPKLTKGQVISLSSVLVAFAIVILATAVDITIRFKSKHEMDIDEVIRKKNALRQFSYVFSAYGNARKILDTSIPTTHLSSLHGIKFLSISWVMLGHVYYCKDYLTLAGLNKVRDLGSNLAFQVVLNSAFAADTFFFLSGLLVVYSTFLYLENNNGHFTIVGFYIRRYWRLTPAFLMISGVILLGPLAGSGPIWHETLHPFVSGCENYWWTNLFYFSNFVPTDKTCVPHGWFLSCDMQFYIVAPIIILALYRRPKLGILLIILGILSSMITTGFLTFLYDLPPVSLFSLPDPKDINEYLDTVGYKPYTHYASYCVGMATGFLLAAKQKISISRYLQTFGWIISTIGCCLVIYGTWNWNSGELPSWPVSVAYASTSRTVWCVGVAWLTVVCYAGHGGPVNSILSWHGFIPLSRLSYLAYLIHPLLMYLYASYVRSPFYFSQYVVVYLYLGHVCVTFGLAFLFSLAFEVPFLNLEKLILKYLDRSRRKRRASFSSHHNNWQHPEHPEMKDSVVLMRRRPDKFLT